MSRRRRAIGGNTLGVGEGLLAYYDTTSAKMLGRRCVGRQDASGGYYRKTTNGRVCGLSSYGAGSNL